MYTRVRPAGRRAPAVSGTKNRAAVALAAARTGFVLAVVGQSSRDPFAYRRRSVAHASTRRAR